MFGVRFLVMNDRLRVEINGHDEFWGKAVLVEWEHQYPERRLNAEPNGRYLLIEADWLNDLKRIAGDCFSEVLVGRRIPGGVHGSAFHSRRKRAPKVIALGNTCC